MKPVVDKGIYIYIFFCPIPWDFWKKYIHSIKSKFYITHTRWAPLLQQAEYAIYVTRAPAALHRSPFRTPQQTQTWLWDAILHRIKMPDDYEAIAHNQTLTLHASAACAMLLLSSYSIHAPCRSRLCYMPQGPNPWILLQCCWVHDLWYPEFYHPQVSTTTYVIRAPLKATHITLHTYHTIQRFIVFISSVIWSNILKLSDAICNIQDPWQTRGQNEHKNEVPSHPCTIRFRSLLWSVWCPPHKNEHDIRTWTWQSKEIINQHLHKTHQNTHQFSSIFNIFPPEPPEFP